MHIRWYGQSAFLLAGFEGSVMGDPIRDTAAMRGRVRFDYPPVAGVAPDLMLVTHDHADHELRPEQAVEGPEVDVPGAPDGVLVLAVP